MNSTPTAHPDLNSLQQLAATQDPLVQNGIRVELQGKALWRTFYEIGTEMIITKVGRRMFPAIRIKVSGLKPQKKYAMLLDIEAVDDNRYRYVYHSSKVLFKMSLLVVKLILITKEITLHWIGDLRSLQCHLRFPLPLRSAKLQRRTIAAKLS